MEEDVWKEDIVLKTSHLCSQNQRKLRAEKEQGSLFLWAGTSVVTDDKCFNNICPEGIILMTLFNQTMHINGDATAGKTCQSLSLSLGSSDYQWTTQITDNLHSTFKTEPSLVMLQRQKWRQNHREQETLKNFIVMVMAERKTVTKYQLFVSPICPLASKNFS